MHKTLYNISRVASAPPLARACERPCLVMLPVHCMAAVADYLLPGLPAGWRCYAQSSHSGITADPV